MNYTQHTKRGEKKNIFTIITQRRKKDEIKRKSQGEESLRGRINLKKRNFNILIRVRIRVISLGEERNINILIVDTPWGKD